MMSIAKPLTDPAAAVSREWDVIVVGTGVGGATLGRSLALSGLSVLFLEKGGRISASEDNGAAVTPESRMAQGWWPHPVSRRLPSGARQRFYAAVGCASGGSSIHYAAALERMPPSDFDALQTSDTATAPWPVSFTEFEPHYAAAEKLYGLTAESSSLAERRMSEWDRALMEQMRRNGLAPQPLHVAMRYDEQCEECVGRICPRDCKSDARVACLEDALRQPNCAMLEHCDVQTLDADENLVRVVKAKHLQADLELRAKVVVLSAGALHSPQILLRSSNHFWPRGLANSSDQVGRNLMFHTSDVFAIWAPRRLSRHGRQRKSISVRDFYVHQGRRLGYVQSMGLEAGRGEIAVYVKDQLRRRGVRNEFLLSLLAKLPSDIGAFLFGGAGIFAAMSEDDPNPDNRIVLDPGEPDGASFSYTITDDLRRRAEGLRQEFSRRVKPWRMLRISPELEMNYGHPCGTCRFGDERKASVLDRNCRTHDLENLYVVDSSFMPRSGAINPSLTIAANALRVAPQIAARFPHVAATARRGSTESSDQAARISS
jgi:choline dehydrogenase-like flavoprotein